MTTASTYASVPLMFTYTVEHVTNVSTGAFHDAGQVVAEDHEQATDRALEAGLIPLFQTFRIRKDGPVLPCGCTVRCDGNLPRQHFLDHGFQRIPAGA